MGLFATILGEDFGALEPQIQQVHGGIPQTLTGRVSVERGTSMLATALGRLAALPPNLTLAPLEVTLQVTGDTERWVRVFAHCYRMTSTLSARDGRLRETVGLVALTFRLVVRLSHLDWILERVTACGIPLPTRWFVVSATITVRDRRYHFDVTAGVRGIGRLIHYAGDLGDGS
jgi:hypothetical protein